MFKSVFSNVKLKLQLKAAMPTFDTTPAARPLNLHGTTEKKGTRVMGVGEIGEPGGGRGGGSYCCFLSIQTMDNARLVHTVYTAQCTRQKETRWIQPIRAARLL